ncbi:hypothetical protein LTR16_004930, partial [Cryomyces antarcticus]
TTTLAVLRFADFVSAEYGAQDVLAFAVHPGGVPSEMGPEGAKGYPLGADGYARGGRGHDCVFDARAGSRSLDGL